MSAITLDTMKEKLLSIETVQERLAALEPSAAINFDESSKISFEVGEQFSEIAASTHATAPSDVRITVDGSEYSLSNEAFFQATSSVGLSQAYVRKTPANLIQDQMNYWFSTPHKESLRPLVIESGNLLAGFSKPTIEPYSNVDLLASAVEGIESRYGNVEILADYKMTNTLNSTDVRLILPTTALQVADTGMIDIPAGKNDEWSLGLHLHNSLLGHSQTSVDAYLFRWWCTNGATTEVGIPWSRRRGDVSEVFDWARESVDSILGHAEDLFTALHALSQTNIDGNVTEILQGIFTEFKISARYRTEILEELLSYNPITMYHVMQAITRIANVPENHAVADRLMRIGGAITQHTFDSKNAQIWYEGRSASDEDVNPYEIVIAQ